MVAIWLRNDCSCSKRKRLHQTAHVSPVYLVLCARVRTPSTMKYVAAGMDFVAAGRKNAVFVQKTPALQLLKTSCGSIKLPRLRIPSSVR